MKLDLEKQLTVTVKVIDDIFKGKTVAVTCTVQDLAEIGISSMLIDEGYFSSMGHPSCHYELISIEYES